MAGRAPGRRLRTPTRDHEIRRAVASVCARRPVGVAVVGEQGDGTSAVAAAVVDAAADAGRPVRTTVATAAVAPAAFAALAPVLHDVVDADALTGDAAGVACSVGGLRQLAAESPVVLWIDDAHHLDELAAAAVAHTTRSGHVVPVLSLRGGRSPPPSLEALWRDSSVTRIDLRPLDPAEAAAMVVDLLDGPVDAAVAIGLVRLVGARPGRLVETVDANLAQGVIAFDRGTWRQRSPLQVPPSLLERATRDLHERLGVVDDANVEAHPVLTALAITGSLPLSLLTRALGTSVVREAETTGLAAVATTDAGPAVITLADPLHASLVGATATDRMKVAGQLLSSMEGRAADPVLDAVVRLEAGRELDRDSALGAARLAHEEGREVLAERICRRVLAAALDLEVSLLLGDILTVAGRGREADDLFAALEPRDEETVAVRAMARAANLLLRLDDSAGAARVLDDVLDAIAPDTPWSDELRGQRAVVAVFAGRFTEAIRTVEPMLDHRDGRPFVEAAVAAAPALLVTGRCTRAAELAQRGFDLRSELSAQQTLAPAAVHAVSRSLALTLAGDLEAADELGSALRDGAAALGNRDGQAWGGIVAGWAQLERGLLHRAERSFRDALVAAVDVSLVHHFRWAAAGVLLAVAQRGDRDATADALAVLDSAPAGETVLMGSELHRARGWAAACRGQRAAALRHVHDGLALSRATGQHALAVIVLHDLVRLGSTDRVDELESTAAMVDGDYAPARAAHGRALAAGDPVALDRASRALADTGAHLAAAEAAMQAALLARRAGDPARARSLEDRARSLAAACEDPVTPALSMHPGLATLTDREHEVAVLAAAELTSRDIATELGVSVRTVDNLLQRSYQKLGATGRADLRDLL